MVVEMVWFDVAITETVVPAALFATYTWLPSGVTATPKGFVHTVMVLVTVLFEVAMIDTVPAPKFLTYTSEPSGVIPQHQGGCRL
jgi:phosphatidylserine synthase